MEQLFGFFEGITSKGDGDWTDRLNYRLTPLALVLVASFITGWSYVGQPIQCWYPATFTDFWKQYGDDVCFAKGTYHVSTFEKTLNVSGPSGMHIRVDKSIKDEIAINYYQWIGFFLLLQAALFYLPVYIWRALCSHGNMNVDTILDVINWRGNFDGEARKRNTKKVASFISHKHEMNPSAGKYTFLCYLFTKFLFLSNVVLQFIAVKYFLGQKDYMWGWEHSKLLWVGNETETPTFPRVTLCNFDVRVLGDVNKHTVQCLLTINFLNEKVFFAMWWWLLFVFSASLTSLLQWMFYFVIPGRGVDMVSRFMPIIDAKSKKDRVKIKSFVGKELRTDGIFLIEMILVNEGEMPAIELLKALWEGHHKELEKTLDHRKEPYEDGDSFSV